MNKIRWWHIAYRLRNILGRNKFTILQSRLKYLQRFHGDYHYGGKHTVFTRRTYVFMIDGKTIHGGLSDRLRGAFSVYCYCKDRGIDFKICWFYPFNLYDYLQPSTVDWIVEKDQLSFNLNDTEFKFFNTYTGLDSKTEAYYQMLESDKPEVHVYSNVSIEENRYSEYFNDLFVPSSALKKVVESCTKEIGGKYISITFRFIGLLADFNDDVRWLKKEDGMDSSFYIRKCLAYIEKKHLEYQEYKILVTSDSILFLQEAKKLPYVYIIPGEIKHMDYNDENDQLSQLKSFADFLMVSRAEKCFSYSVGNMFRLSRFAKTAALIGEKEFIAVCE